MTSAELGSGWGGVGCCCQDPKGPQLLAALTHAQLQGGLWRMGAGGVTAGPDRLLRRGKTGKNPPPLSPLEFSSSVLLAPCSPHPLQRCTSSAWWKQLRWARWSGE